MGINCILDNDMCCEVEGQGRGQGESHHVQGHLHNDVTVTGQGSSNDVVNTQYCATNTDAVANSNG